MSCLMRPKGAGERCLGSTSLSVGESKSIALVSPRILESAKFENCLGLFLN